MVFGFLVLSNAASERHATFSQFFTTEGNDEHRNGRVEIVADAILLRISQDPAIVDDNMKELRSIIRNSRSADGEGIFKLQQDELFSSQMIVLFQAFQKCTFAIILENSENRAAASKYLANIYSFFSNRWRDTKFTLEDVLKRVEEIITYNHYFIPCGRILITTNETDAHLRGLFEKDIMTIPKK